MSTLSIMILVLALSVVGFFLGRSRALASADGDRRILHSLPNYYGYHVAMATILPAVGVLLVWLLLQPGLIEGRVVQYLPADTASADSNQDLLISDVRRVATGFDRLTTTGLLTDDEVAALDANTHNIRQQLGGVGIALGGDVTPEILAAAKAYRGYNNASAVWMAVVVLVVAFGAMVYAVFKTNKDFRARNRVERRILLSLFGAASIAVLTTFGIVTSMLFETINFFDQYPFVDFFFGTTWAPNFRGGSDLALLPLLWGTLYISFIALVIAVPIGLFSAIYLSEYAGPKMRAVAKPMIEILAGIPTIVYGLFALITVGPMLRDYIAQPMGLGQSSASVMTAGLVMGIMLIPFVSSLSDDIINAVPQTMRDASLGLGATKSETIRQVIVPAALPGIVGAILLAASRAIGETMIVVLGAGAAAKLSLNPFEAMTTVTVKIVSQLTGDTDFAAPETLVAFALGLTLFVITLGLNIVALIIVRKYREQYE